MYPRVSPIIPTALVVPEGFQSVSLLVSLLKAHVPIT
jgi:hypothetical protein